MDGAPTLASRRPPARQYKTERLPTTRAMRPPSPAGLRAPPASTCKHPCAHAPSVVYRSAVPARQYKAERQPTTMRPPSPAGLRADVRRGGRVEGVN